MILDHDESGIRICLLCGHIHFGSMTEGLRNMTPEEKQFLRNHPDGHQVKQKQERIVQHMWG